MGNCSNHRKDLFGQTDMKVVAEAIGDLHYETLAKLLKEIGNKIFYDSRKDRENGRTKLASQLWQSSLHIGTASGYISEASKISEPFMKQIS